MPISGHRGGLHSWGVVGHTATEQIGAGCLRQAEVQDLDRPIGADLHVGRLQIAVDDALLVRRFERLGDLPRDGQRLVEGDGALRDAIRKRRPFDEFEHERLRAVRVFETVDRRDVRMVQRGKDFGLTLEASEAIRVSGERRG